MLDTGAKAVFYREVSTQNDATWVGLDRYSLVEEPEDVCPEQCFYHTGHTVPGKSFAMIHNEKLRLAAVVCYDGIQCPILCQWKPMKSGDYVVGLEPTTSGTRGEWIAGGRACPGAGAAGADGICPGIFVFGQRGGNWTLESGGGFAGEECEREITFGKDN